MQHNAYYTRKVAPVKMTTGTNRGMHTAIYFFGQKESSVPFLMFLDSRTRPGAVRGDAMHWNTQKGAVLHFGCVWLRCACRRVYAASCKGRQVTCR
jgi:hypothetical protein